MTAFLDPNSPPEPPTADPSVSPSSTGYSPATDSPLNAWSPASEEEARAAIDEVGTFCARKCPIRLACIEDECDLYRLEGRALSRLGLERNPATEAVGVIGQNITAL